jgi:hypothetical protein
MTGKPKNPTLDAFIHVETVAALWPVRETRTAHPSWA